MHSRGHQLVAFPAMIFVGASWGANVPVSKVMLAHFDLIPMSAIRTAVAGAALGLLLLLVEGAKALRIDLDFRRFALLGLMMGGFFAVYTLGLQFSNPITAATVAVAGPLVSAVTVRLVTGLRFDPGFPVALALTLLGGAILVSSTLVGSGSVTFGGGEIVVLLSNSIWTLYSIKAQAWFDRASQLHRAYVASLSAFGWTTLLSVLNSKRRHVLDILEGLDEEALRRPVLPSGYMPWAGAPSRSGRREVLVPRGCCGGSSRSAWSTRRRDIAPRRTSRGR